MLAGRTGIEAIRFNYIIGEVVEAGNGNFHCCW